MSVLFFLLLVLLFSLLGSLFGVGTGLTPGVHVNMVALFLLLAAPGLVGFLVNDLALVSSPWEASLLVALLVLATSIVHSFVDFIPSVFLGAPDEDTALSVLPGHRLLLQGEGYTAVCLSVWSSFLAVLLCFLLLVPFALLIPEPVNLYGLIREGLFWILLGICALLILTEQAGSRLPALGCFLLAGVLGLLVPERSLGGLLGPGGSPLFPVLTGLFGVPTLLLSLGNEPELPRQRLPGASLFPLGQAGFVRASFKGCLAGSLVGFLPGVSSSHAAVLASLGRGGGQENPGTGSVEEDENFIVTLSSINTANAFFCLAALFLIGRARSGATLAISGMLAVPEWSGQPPAELYLLLGGALVSAVFGLLATLALGRLAAEHIHKIPYSKVVGGVLVLVLVLVILFTGLEGLLFLTVSSLIGLLPPVLGVRRSQLMAVLLLPVLLFFSPV